MEAQRKGEWAFVLLAAAYSWWAAGLRPFTRPSLVATLAAGLAAMALGARRGRRPISGPAPAGAGLWLVLLLALGAWELASFLSHPRSAHPTLSSLVNSLLDTREARAAGMFGWLMGAVALARR